jgi:uncharacterized DUF497 family protein
MEIEFDPAKRRKTLEERGLDFAEAAEILNGPQYTRPDMRIDYAEPRFQTVGLLDGRMVMLVWTPTRTGMRVISLRKCNDREQKKYIRRMG